VRRGAVVQLVVFGLVAAAFATAVALGFHWLPKSASKQADRIFFLYWLATGISILVFSVVTSVLIYSIIHFRAAPDDMSDGPPIHGNTKLELAWTLGPTILVIVIGVASAIVLSRNSDAGTNPLIVNVTAQQFAWEFTYPHQGNVTAAELRLPLNRTVKLVMQTKDVIHSFWVPEFAQKQDVVPGITTTLVITPDRLGTYPVICTELCGLGHALMRSEAIVMQPAAFDAWAKGVHTAVSGGGPAAGKAVFAAQGCSACHTFKAAGATGKVGPDLDKAIYKDAQLAGLSVPDFVRQSIVDPNAYISPGFPKNVMPGNFGSLPKSQLDALINFLVPTSTKTVSP
jgi:cytochrome c oxidase subunit II